MLTPRHLPTTATLPSFLDTTPNLWEYSLCFFCSLASCPCSRSCGSTHPAVFPVLLLRSWFVWIAPERRVVANLVWTTSTLGLGLNLDLLRRGIPNRRLDDLAHNPQVALVCSCQSNPASKKGGGGLTPRRIHHDKRDRHRRLDQPPPRHRMALAPWIHKNVSKIPAHISRQGRTYTPSPAQP